MNRNGLVQTFALSTFLCSLAAFALMGCSKSKEDIAVGRMNRPGPGGVRVLNMTGAPIDFDWAGRQVDPAIPAGTAGLYCQIGSGRQEIVVSRSGADLLKFKMDVKSKELHTVAVFGSGTNVHYLVIAGEQPKPQANRNIVAYFLDESGKTTSGSVTVSNGKDRYEVSDGSNGELINVGDYKITGDGLVTARGAKVESDSSYSLIVLKTNDGSRQAYLLRNTFIDKPMATGLAAN